MSNIILALLNTICLGELLQLYNNYDFTILQALLNGGIFNVVSTIVQRHILFLLVCAATVVWDIYKLIIYLRERRANNPELK